MNAISEHAHELRAIAGGRAGTPQATIDEKGRLHLPPLPAHDDRAAQCAWLTAVFQLNPEHPITGGTWQGQRGPDGHIALTRADALGIRFEPARAINTPMKLIECFTGRRHPGDRMLPAFKSEHCRQIAYILECLCAAGDALTEEQEALGIIGTFLQAAVPVEGRTTHGTSAQRFEAARALRRDFDDASGRPVGPPRYLLDAGSGQRLDERTGEIIDQGRPAEYVIAVSELADAARRHVGSSLQRGWLDARMEAIGWQRIAVDGHQAAGRGGRQGPHATVLAYRGCLPDSGQGA